MTTSSQPIRIDGLDQIGKPKDAYKWHLHRCHFSSSSSSSSNSKLFPRREREIMGLLDKLWDDTVAGPLPDTGLGRLRKFQSFTIRTDFGGKDVVMEGGNNGMRTCSEDSPVGEETPRVTRSIMIRRPAGCPSRNGTPPESPGGSTPPVSPFLGSPAGRDWNRFRRKSMPDAYGRSGSSAPSAWPAAPATQGPVMEVVQTAGFGSSNHYSPFEM